MKWSTLTFGKHRGKTFPQILVVDPDWFFWIWPDLYGPLRPQADELVRRATAIKIPKNRPEKWCVEYWLEDDRTFGHFSLVKADSHQNEKWAVRERHLDLSWARRCKAYDKKGNKYLIRDFREYYFPGRNLTKKRIEAFFNDDDNFVRCSSGGGKREVVRP
jgi:hypothetical protein